MRQFFVINERNKRKKNIKIKKLKPKENSMNGIIYRIKIVIKMFSEKYFWILDLYNS